MTYQLATHMRRRVLNESTAISLILAATMLAGCGRSSLESALPMAPSSIGSSEAGSPDDSATATSSPMNHSLFHGAVTAPSGTCPAVSFALPSGLSVVTSATTTYAGGACAGLVAGALVQVSGAVQADGRLLASSITFEATAPAPGEVSLNGSVGAPVLGTCPAKTFILGTNIVFTNATTVYVGGACAGLVTGAAVQIVGARQEDGRILASRVTLGANEAPGNTNEVSGAVVAPVTGTCPALDFHVGTTHVTTSATTQFSGGMCASVIPGAMVKVSGTRQADGTLQASRVELGQGDDDEDDEDDSVVPMTLDGTVSRFRGRCPSVTFNLKGTTIVANTTTTYSGGACKDLRPSVKVVVTGMGREHQNLVASKITITKKKKKK